MLVSSLKTLTDVVLILLNFLPHKKLKMKATTVIITILISVVTTASTMRDSAGETEAVKSDFKSVLAKICTEVGIDTADVEVEVNQFFNCMSESINGRNPNAPLVIPTSHGQMYTLFKMNKDYLMEQCPSFQQRQPCAKRFVEFVESCSLEEYQILPPNVHFTYSMAIDFSMYGERMCRNNGDKFMAFINETEKSCSDPNLAGLYNRLQICNLVRIQENRKSVDGFGITKSNDGHISVDNFRYCIMKNYQDTCSGTTVAKLLLDTFVNSKI